MRYEQRGQELNKHVDLVLLTSIIGSIKEVSRIVQSGGFEHREKQERELELTNQDLIDFYKLSKETYRLNQDIGKKGRRALERYFSDFKEKDRDKPIDFAKLESVTSERGIGEIRGLRLTLQRSFGISNRDLLDLYSQTTRERFFYHRGLGKKCITAVGEYLGRKGIIDSTNFNILYNLMDLPVVNGTTLRFKINEIGELTEKIEDSLIKRLVYAAGLTSRDFEGHLIYSRERNHAEKLIEKVERIPIRKIIDYHHIQGGCSLNLK